MDSNDVPWYIKCGKIILCRQKDQPYYVGRILTVDKIRRRVYSRFEDGITHWCSFNNVQQLDLSCDKCCLCRRSTSASSVVVCSRCKLGFHIRCHNPAVEVTDPSWLCHLCGFVLASSPNGVLSHNSRSLPVSNFRRSFFINHAASSPKLHKYSTTRTTATNGTSLHSTAPPSPLPSKPSSASIASGSSDEKRKEEPQATKDANVPSSSFLAVDDNLETQSSPKCNGDESKSPADETPPHNDADESHILISDDSFRVENPEDQSPPSKQPSTNAVKFRLPSSAVSQRRTRALTMSSRGILQHYGDHSRWIYASGIRRRRRAPQLPVPRRVASVIRKNSTIGDVGVDGFRRPVGRPRKDRVVLLRQISPRKSITGVASGGSSAPVGMLKLLPNVVEPSDVEETIASSEDRDVDKCLRSAVQRHFGAVGRLQAGARCRVVARRCTVGDRVEYLVQWDGGIIT